MKRLLIVFALAAAAAHAQTPTGKVFENIKPGLYRMTTTSEMLGVSSATQQERSTETEDRCVTRKELDKGLELPGGCAIKKREESANGAHIVSECKNGTTNELRVVRSGDGFSSAITSRGKGADGKPFSMNMKVDSKYLGPCKG